MTPDMLKAEYDRAMIGDSITWAAALSESRKDGRKASAEVERLKAEKAGLESDKAHLTVMIAEQAAMINRLEAQVQQHNEHREDSLSHNTGEDSDTSTVTFIDTGEDSDTSTGTFIDTGEDSDTSTGTFIEGLNANLGSVACADLSSAAEVREEFDAGAAHSLFLKSLAPGGDEVIRWPPGLNRQPRRRRRDQRRSMK